MGRGLQLLLAVLALLALQNANVLTPYLDALAVPKDSAPSMGSAFLPEDTGSISSSSASHSLYFLPALTVPNLRKEKRNRALSTCSAGQQALSLGSAFPGDDTGDTSSTPSPPAATTPPSPAAASTSPSTSPAGASSSPASSSPSPAAAPSKTPAPAPAAGAPAKAPAATPMMAPATAPAAAAKAPAPGSAGASAGAPAPMGAAIATGGADMMAPAPGPAVAPQINIVYIQQANNARMTPSTTDPTSGVLSMNGALDTTLFDQDTPFRKLGKTSSQNFLNAATAPAGAAPTGPNQWFAPAPTGILLGFNTSANVYILMSLSAPVYNYTTATVNFNYLLQNPVTAQANNATNGWLVNLFTNQPDFVSGAVPFTNITKEVTLFTPSLLTTVPCVANPVVAKGSCTITNSPGTVCAAAGQHGAWVNGTFCA